MSASQRDDERPPDRGLPDGEQPRTSSGWARLLRMGRPRATKANLLVAALAVVLGFAMVTQVHEHRSSGLENLSQGDLIALLDGVNQQSMHLDQEKAKLTRTRDSLRGSGNDKAAIAAATERKQALGILAGTLPATGPGVTITIADSKRVVDPASVLDAVEELRDAGAEAIQVGTVRVVASTWFGSAGDGGLTVDGHPLAPPYVIRAIGDAHTMSTAMSIPGGVVDSLTQLGAHPTVTSMSVVNIDALRAPKTPRYAQATAGAK